MALFQVFDSQGNVTMDDESFVVHGVEVTHVTTGPDDSWQVYGIDDSFVAIGVYGKDIPPALFRWEKYRSSVRVQAGNGERIIFFYNKPPPANLTRRGIGLELYDSSGQVVASTNVTQFEVISVTPIDYRNNFNYVFNLVNHYVYVLINSQIFWEYIPSANYNVARQSTLGNWKGVASVGWVPILDLSQNRNFNFSLNNPAYRATLLTLRGKR